MLNKGKWITEYQSDTMALSLEVNDILYEGKSEFQDILIADTKIFGTVLVLDGVFQTSLFEEWVYHEMIVHVPLNTHPNPEKVLVIGGGDGGTVREVLRHPSVKHVDHVEIDGEVIRLAKEYFPQISCALIEQPERLHTKIGDGIKKVAETENEYDVIIVDCSDPIGPGEGLFTAEFYRNAQKALKKDGVFVQQTESPYFHAELVHDCFAAISDAFPITRLYLAPIPLYPGGLHCFTIGSKLKDPLKELRAPAELGAMKYYNEKIQKAAFVLPEFIKEIIYPEDNVNE